MERADGTQARLKPDNHMRSLCSLLHGGKGGWDSGEIETLEDRQPQCCSLSCGKGGWDSGEIET